MSTADLAFQDWLNGRSSAAATARELIKRDKAAWNAVSHAFQLCYLQGCIDGAETARSKVIAAANTPIGQVPA